MNEMQREGQPIPVTVPTLTRGWRMQMALDHGGRSVEYMALKCGVSRSTVSRWINDGGKRPPRRGDMEIWARECRVPLEWLAPSDDDGDAPKPTVGLIRLNIAAPAHQPVTTSARRGVLTLVAPR